MSWAISAATFILGSVLGYFARSLLNRHNDNHENDAEQAKLELSQYKQEVADNLILHHQQLSQLTEQINRLNQHWNESSTTLNSENETKPLPTLSTNNTEHSNSLICDSLVSVTKIDNKNKVA